MTAGRRVVVALLTILPLAVTPARATYVSFHSPVVGPAEIAALQQRILESPTVGLEHDVARNVPAPFPTRRRCRVRVDAGHFGHLLGSDDVTAFAKALGVSRITGPDTALVVCGPDTSRYDTVTLSFGRGGRAVVATLDLTAGKCIFYWDDSLSLATRLSRADVMPLVASHLPDDSLIAGIHECVPKAPSPGEPPQLGEFVYIEELPEAVSKTPPSYPEDARRANVDGTVMVQALVNKSGEVAETIVLRSIPMLDPAAIGAAEQWRFNPARANGKPVAVWVAIPLKFTLH